MRTIAAFPAFGIKSGGFKIDAQRPERLAVPTSESSLPSISSGTDDISYGFPIRAAIAFAARDGEVNGSLVKRAQRTLRRLHDPLSKFLEPGETVLYVSPGQIRPDFPERFMLGIGYRILTRGALILTDRRLIHVPLKQGGYWLRRIRAVRLTDIKAFKLTEGFRARLSLHYRNGKRETFWHLPGSAARTLQSLLESLVKPDGNEVGDSKGMASFCPTCFAELSPGVYTCDHCGQKFKDQRGVLLHGLAIPGGAFFYAELHLLGIAHAFGDASLLVSALASLLAFLGRIDLRVPGHVGPPTWFFGLTAAVSFAALLADLWLSLRVAKKLVRNFIPSS
jgi:hypothetical protein